MGGRGGGVRNFWRVHEMDRFKWSIFGNVCDEMEKVWINLSPCSMRRGGSSNNVVTSTRSPIKIVQLT